jgi:glucuronosyltransferase
MSKIQLIFTICLINLIQLSGSANILAIFYYPSYSHQVVFASLIRDLSERGHNLTVLAVDKMNYNHPNITEIHLKNSYDDNINFVDSSGLAGLRLVYNFIKASFIRTELQLNQPEVRELIDNHKNYKFDLLILEYIYASPHIGFSDLFNCPIVGFTAIDTGIPTHQKLGSSANPFIHPEIFFPYQHGKMTFFQRVSSFMFYIGLNFVLEPLFIAYGEYQATRIFKQKITLSEVEEKLQVLFVNTNPKLDYVRPITANMIQLGNMHIEPPKKLNSKLQEILDSSENGVIYMSLGEVLYNPYSLLS